MLQPVLDLRLLVYPIFLFNDTATTEIYTLSLHDALPISVERLPVPGAERRDDQELRTRGVGQPPPGSEDRKSTRLNSSHPSISYAVFCLKKKKQSYLIIGHATKSFSFLLYRMRYHVRRAS